MVDKATQKQILANMDEAAQQAIGEFKQLPEETQRLAAAWVKKWYLKAGYKRLGRYLVKFAKDQAKKENGE